MRVYNRLEVGDLMPYGINVVIGRIGARIYVFIPGFRGTAFYSEYRNQESAEASSDRLKREVYPKLRQNYFRA